VNNTKKTTVVLHVYKILLAFEGGIPAIIRQITGAKHTAIQSRILVTSTLNTYKEKEANLTQVKVYKTFSFGNIFSMPVAPLFPLWFWVQARKSDIVDYHYPFPLVDLALFIYFPKKTQLVVHWHADITKQKKLLTLVAPLIRNTLRRADKILVSSPVLIEKSPFLATVKQKCQVIPFGIAPHWFDAPDAKMLQTVRAEYPNFILAVGRLVNYKGFDILIEAMQFIDIPVIIVGEGIELERLQHLAKEYEVSDKVIFTGKISARRLKCYYHACHLFAFPSITEAEAFGIVQLEAMVCRKPIVNTALNSAVPWVARDGKEAITVPTNDANALQQAINRLLNDDILAKQMGAAAYQRVINYFSDRYFLDKTHRTYQTLKKTQKSKSPTLK
jgi:rhamnosyl/mannosyltransferase